MSQANDLMAEFPHWKVNHSPYSGKFTARRRTLKGKILIKGISVQGMRTAMAECSKREFEGVK